MIKKCKDCAKRHPGCQNITTCEIYREMMLRNQQIKESRAKYKMLDDVERRTIIRIKNAKRNRKSMKD